MRVSRSPTAYPLRVTPVLKTILTTRLPQPFHIAPTIVGRSPIPVNLDLYKTHNEKRS